MAICRQTCRRCHLSGEVALTTPLDSWLASGVRAVDHCVESICCSDDRYDLKKKVDDACLGAFKNLVPGLLKTVKNPESAEARLECHLGAASSTMGVQHAIMAGCSHGIGHMLGPYGVQVRFAADA